MAGYRGPLIVVGLGAGFAAVGAVPVAITFSMGVRSSATIIGMGFVGFGALLMTPGLVWCLVLRTQHGLRSLRRRRELKNSVKSDSGAMIDGSDGSPDRKTGRKHVTGGVGRTSPRCEHADDLFKQRREEPDEDESEDGENTPALSRYFFIDIF